MSTGPFHYRRISSELVECLSEAAQNGESTVLLGPRYIGKRWVSAQVRAALESDNYPVVRITLPHQIPTATASQLKQLVSRAVTKATRQSEAGLKVKSGDPLLGAIDTLRPCRVYLLASNVDAMSHDLARRFLQEVRTRVTTNQIVALLSGEDDFRDLIHGPKSEFNCANQYVIQGFDFGEFRPQALGYAQALNLRFRSPDKACRNIFNITGGNVRLMNLLLNSVFESRLWRKTPHETLVEVSEIPVNLAEVRGTDFCRAEVFRHPTRLLSRAPECCSPLESLIQNQEVDLGLSQDAPTYLELAGVAIREKNKLYFSSTLIQDFTTLYYTKRRFGDLHARNGNWEGAFEFYRQLDREEKLRPISTDDRIEVDSVIRALGASLHVEIAKGLKAVKELFADGCHHVLGFSEIIFLKKKDRWLCQKNCSVLSSKSRITQIAKILPLGTKALAPGLLPVSGEAGQYCLAAILPGIRFDQMEAVVVGELARKRVISRERERFVKHLLKNLVQATVKAVSDARVRRRLQMRNELMEIINSIFESLGSDVLDAKHALEMAARRSFKLGYRRVLFCLVDPEREKIEGVLDQSPDKTFDVAKHTCWSLKDPLADLQPYVIHTKRPKIVHDARKEPLANKNVVQNTNMKALAIVPILNRSGEAIGTIHVERRDRTAPSDEEVTDLLLFGRQLAIAIEQCERVNLLQKALDKIPEPVFITDRRRTVRYLNWPGAELLGSKGSGWQGNRAAPLKRTRPSIDCLELIEKAFEKEGRCVEDIRWKSDLSFHRGMALLDTILDWKEEVVGALLHIQDLSYVYRLLSAIQRITEAGNRETAIGAILDAAKVLGHKWGRLYLLDKKDATRLQGTSSFGHFNQDYELRFAAGKVELPKRGESGYHFWLCIEKETPTAFCWMPRLDNGARYRTRYGLIARNLRNPQFPPELEKREGDIWLDFPLIAGGQVLGKLTLDCDPGLHPEEFGFLKVLSEMASAALNAFLKREQEASQRIQLIQRDAAEKITGDVAHNIATRLAVLPLILGMYRRCESQLPELRSINDQMDQILDHVMITIRRAKERLVPVKPDLSVIDLGKLLEEALQMQLPKDSLVFEASSKPVEIQADGHLLETAILEMVQNSQDAFTGSSTLLKIHVRLSEVEDPSGGHIVRIAYSDNGPGIAAKYRERVFEDFFSHRPGGDSGTGLGLGFVRRVIKAHRGRIYVADSQRGARFVMEIPLNATVVTRQTGGEGGPNVLLSDRGGYAGCSGNSQEDS